MSSSQQQQVNYFANQQQQQQAYVVADHNGVYNVQQTQQSSWGSHQEQQMRTQVASGCMPVTPCQQQHVSNWHPENQSYAGGQHGSNFNCWVAPSQTFGPLQAPPPPPAPPPDQWGPNGASGTYTMHPTPPPPPPPRPPGDAYPSLSHVDMAVPQVASFGNGPYSFSNKARITTHGDGATKHKLPSFDQDQYLGLQTNRQRTKHTTTKKKGTNMRQCVKCRKLYCQYTRSQLKRSGGSWCRKCMKTAGDARMRCTTCHKTKHISFFCVGGLDCQMTRRKMHKVSRSLTSRTTSKHNKNHKQDGDSNSPESPTKMLGIIPRRCFKCCTDKSSSEFSEMEWRQQRPMCQVCSQNTKLKCSKCLKLKFWLHFDPVYRTEREGICLTCDKSKLFCDICQEMKLMATFSKRRLSLYPLLNRLACEGCVKKTKGCTACGTEKPFTMFPIHELRKADSQCCACQTKFCRTCQNTKPYKEFWDWDTRESSCKTCERVDGKVGELGHCQQTGKDALEEEEKEGDQGARPGEAKQDGVEVGELMEIQPHVELQQKVGDEGARRDKDGDDDALQKGGRTEQSGSVGNFQSLTTFSKTLQAPTGRAGFAANRFSDEEEVAAAIVNDETKHSSVRAEISREAASADTIHMQEKEDKDDEEQSKNNPVSPVHRTTTPESRGISQKCVICLCFQTHTNSQEVPKNEQLFCCDDCLVNKMKQCFECLETFALQDFPPEQRATEDGYCETCKKDRPKRCSGCHIIRDLSDFSFVELLRFEQCNAGWCVDCETAEA